MRDRANGREPDDGDRLVELGMRLYESRIRELVEPDHIGEYIAIHVDSGDYVIERSSPHAMRSLLKIHPADGRLFIRRIGDQPDYALAARIQAGEVARGKSA